MVDEANALRAQSICDRHGECHSDGWGLGYYGAGSPHPCVVRSVGDAKHDAAYVSAAREVAAPVWIAHVRQGSVGSVAETNCHPFSFGAWLFAHNGTITNFEEIGPRLARDVPDDLLALRQGTTDSELAFIHLLAQLRQRGIDLARPAGRAELLVEILSQLLRDLDRWTAEFPEDEKTKFNFLLTDGKVMAASRWNHDLHWATRDQAVVISSEPIGLGSWQELPEHSILGIDGSGQTQLYSV